MLTAYTAKPLSYFFRKLFLLIQLVELIYVILIPIKAREANRAYRYDGSPLFEETINEGLTILYCLLVLSIVSLLMYKDAAGRKFDWILLLFNLVLCFSLLVFMIVFGKALYFG